MTDQPIIEPLWEVSKDGPIEIGYQRRWLARQLMDSKLTEHEAMSIVAFHPQISDFHRNKK